MNSMGQNWGTFLYPFQSPPWVVFGVSALPPGWAPAPALHTSIMQSSRVRVNTSRLKPPQKSRGLTLVSSPVPKGLHQFQQTKQTPTHTHT